MKTAQELFREAFDTPRDARSFEYKVGMMDALRFRLGETNHCKCPYPEGDVCGDAWWAGTLEGHRRGRDELEARANPGVRSGAFSPVDLKE